MNVVITGVSRGIGKELVHKFCATAGTTVIGVARNKEALEQLAAKHPNFIGMPFDLTSQNWDVLESEFAKLTTIDILINNAGSIVNKPFLNITSSDLQSVYNTNVFAPFKLIQMLKPKLEASNISHVVNISSMGGYQGASKFPGLSAYSSSKAAVACISECLAEEFAGAIHVNALCLGAVQTEMLSEAFPDYQAPTTPVQMADYIYHFSKHQRSFYNGKVLPVSSTTP